MHVITDYMYMARTWCDYVIIDVGVDLLAAQICFALDVEKMAAFHAIQMDDPLDKMGGSSAHDDLFRSATVAQSQLQIRLGNVLIFNNFVLI